MEIEKSDLKEPYASMAEMIGLENVLKLAEMFGGEMIYLPKLDGIMRSVRNKEIREKFNGYNFKDLAKEYGITDVAIRLICSDILQEKRNAPPPGQMSIYDFEKK